MPQKSNHSDRNRDDKRRPRPKGTRRRQPKRAGTGSEVKRPQPERKKIDSTKKRPSERKKPPRQKTDRGKPRKQAPSKERRQPRGAKKIQASRRRKKAYQLIVNQLAGQDPNQPLRLACQLERRLKRRGHECEIHQAKTWDEFVQAAAQAVKQRPYATVVFGGDGSVRLAASGVARAKGLLGIVPCGRFNNIFGSLYGHEDPDKALDLVCSNNEKRIDAGLANGTFFLGSLITGLVPIMIDKLGKKKPPRLAMTWGKMAGQAADETMPQTATMKVDAYTFQVQPLILHIHLLSDIMSLSFAPVATPDDGRLVLIFDRDGTRDVVSHYIRDLKKNRYQYIDGIQMLRGERMTITPASGRVWLIDGDKIEFAGDKIGIEILNRILRIFADAPPKKR